MRVFVLVLATLAVVVQPFPAVATSLAVVAQSPMEAAALAARQASDDARPVLDELRVASATILSDESLTEDARNAAVRALVDERREALTPLIEAMVELTRTQAITLGGMPPAEAAATVETWRAMFWKSTADSLILEWAFENSREDWD